MVVLKQYVVSIYRTWCVDLCINECHTHQTETSESMKYKKNSVSGILTEFIVLIYMLDLLKLK